MVPAKKSLGSRNNKGRFVMRHSQAHLTNDNVNFRKAAEAIFAEERANQHGVLVKRIEEMSYLTSSRQKKMLR